MFEANHCTVSRVWRRHGAYVFEICPKASAMVEAVNTINTVNTVNSVNIANIVDFNAMRYKKQENCLAFNFMI